MVSSQRESFQCSPMSSWGTSSRVMRYHSHAVPSNVSKTRSWKKSRVVLSFGCIWTYVAHLLLHAGPAASVTEAASRLWHGAPTSACRQCATHLTMGLIVQSWGILILWWWCVHNSHSRTHRLEPGLSRSDLAVTFLTQANKAGLPEHSAAYPSLTPPPTDHKVPSYLPYHSSMI